MRILFICIENSNRSQMAEAFAIKHAVNGMEIYSAGSAPGGTVNPRAISFMKELGLDLSGHRSQAIDEHPFTAFEYVISMGCGDNCPFVESAHFEDWQIIDPKQLDDEGFRTVRDYIEIKVVDLLGRL